MITECIQEDEIFIEFFNWFSCKFLKFNSPLPPRYLNEHRIQCNSCGDECYRWSVQFLLYSSCFLRTAFDHFRLPNEYFMDGITLISLFAILFRFVGFILGFDLFQIYLLSVSVLNQVYVCVFYVIFYKVVIFDISLILWLTHPCEVFSTIYELKTNVYQDWVISSVLLNHLDFLLAYSFRVEKMTKIISLVNIFIFVYKLFC